MFTKNPSNVRLIFAQLEVLWQFNYYYNLLDQKAEAYCKFCLAKLDECPTSWPRQILSFRARNRQRRCACSTACLRRPRDADWLSAFRSSSAQWFAYEQCTWKITRIKFLNWKCYGTVKQNFDWIFFTRFFTECEI